MRLILNILLIAGLSWQAEQYLPWWIITVVAASVCMCIYVGRLQAFISGFLGIGLLWFGLAWKVHTDTKGLLSQKITTLFDLGDPIQLIVATGLLGGLLGGLAAISGSALRSLHKTRKHRKSPYL